MKIIPKWDKNNFCKYSILKLIIRAMIKPLLFDSSHLIIILVIDAQHNSNFPFDLIIS